MEIYASTHSLTPASSDGLQWWLSTIFCILHACLNIIGCEACVLMKQVHKCFGLVVRLIFCRGWVSMSPSTSKLDLNLRSTEAPKFEFQFASPTLQPETRAAYTLAYQDKFESPPHNYKILLPISQHQLWQFIAVPDFFQLHNWMATRP